MTRPDPQGARPLPHVVVVGCGFGGLAACRVLARRAVRVTVIDRTNHHLFQPLLYQVATAGLPAPAIAAPIRFILRDAPNITPLLAEVRGFDLDARRVMLEDGSALDYDFLIVAAGSTHSYFGHDDWAPHAPGLKTLADAFEIRRRVLLAFERAERTADTNERQSWLNFVVAGGGATGVELAGTLAEIARHTLKDEFRRIDPCKARVLLVEAAERILGAYPADLARKAQRQLERLGVEVRLRAPVTQVGPESIVIGGESLPARTVLWAAGIAASPLGRALGSPLDRSGRVRIEPDLTMPGRPEIAVVGDLATLHVAGEPVPAIAASAKQMGRRAARNILARLEGRLSEPFRYRDYGQLATIGRNAAVGVIGKIKLSGRPAWWFWLLVHLWFLIGFRNRLIVFFDWAWAYLTFQRSARIFDAGPRPAESSR